MPAPEREEHESDALLMERVAAGDGGALQRLARRHAPALLGHAKRLGVDAALAEDAVQETLVSAWRSAADWRGGATLRAWLRTILSHALRRRLRRRAGEPASHEPIDSLDTLDSLGEAAGWGAGGGAGLDERLASRELVWRSLGDLDEASREVLLLVDGEGFSLEEAASIVGVGLAALKSRLHRARLRFMAAVREAESGVEHAR